MPNPITSKADKPEGIGPAAEPVERTVRMLRRFRQYNRGEVAGFGRSLADELIRQGVAADVASASGPSFVRK